MKKLTFALCALFASNLTFASDAHAPAAKPVGDAAAGKAKIATCTACHNADGNSAVPDFPKIAGQHASYIVSQLKEFKSGGRKNPSMSPMAAPLTEQDMLDLAAYYSSQTIKVGKADESLVAQGETIYRIGIAEKGVPACTACHSPQGNGNPASEYPKVGGQHAAYIEKQLQDYKNGVRAADATGGNKFMMKQVASKLDKDEMKAVAAYISGLH